MQHARSPIDYVALHQPTSPGLLPIAVREHKLPFLPGSKIKLKHADNR